MIDSYKEGQELLPDDFSQPYYCPPDKYDHVVVDTIAGGAVELIFVDFQGDETLMDVSKSDMEKMLGWDLTVEPDSAIPETPDDTDQEG